MAMFDELGGLVASGPNLTRIASSIGASDDTTRTAISAAVPILLAGLDRHARSFAGSRAMFDLVQRDDGAVLTDIAGHISRGDSDGRGSTLVDAILGGRRSMIEQTISSSTELGIGPISQLLTSMAPLVVGIVGRKQSAQNLDQASVVSALAADRAEMESIGYGSWLGLLEGGDEAADTQNFVATADRVTTMTSSATPTSPLTPPRVVADPAAPGAAPTAQPPSALAAEVPPPGTATPPTGSNPLGGSPTAPAAGTAPGGATPLTSRPAPAPSAFEATPPDAGSSGMSGAAKAGAVGAAGLGAAAAGAASGLGGAAKSSNPAEAAGAEAAARFRGAGPTGDVDPSITSPDVPNRPGMPDGPGMPDRPGMPDGPGMPDRPGMPDGPGMPGRPDVPDPSVTSTMPRTPDAPKVTINDVSTPSIGSPSAPGTKIESSNYSIGAKPEEKTGGGWLKWLLPLALLILFGFLLRQCLASDADEVVAPDPTVVPTEVAEEPTPEPTPEPTLEPTAIPTVAPEPELGPEIGNYIDGQLLNSAYNSGNFDTMLGAVESAGLRDALEEPGPFTLFAPTDDAFNALPESLREDLDENPDLMAQVLTYHLVPNSVAAADLASGAISAIDGQNLFVDVGEETTQINGATVTAADIPSSNGVAHAIDQVLIPPSLFGSSRMTLNSVLGLSPISFDLGSAAITADGELVLEKAFAYLANSDARLAIGGHTDNVGSEAANLELSQKRAESVMQSLIERGIDPSRLRAIGYGASQPIADNASPEGQAQNRRIELTAS